MRNYRDRLYTLIHMTDNNHFDPIFLFTMIFPTVYDVSIYNNPSVLLSTVAVLKIQPSVETKLLAVMEVSLQLSSTCPAVFVPLPVFLASLQICFLLLFLSAEFPGPLKISPADSISSIRLHSSSLVQFALRDWSICFGIINASTQQQFIYTKGRRLTIITNDTNYFPKTNLGRNFNVDRVQFIVLNHIQCLYFVIERFSCHKIQRHLLFICFV